MFLFTLQSTRFISRFWRLLHYGWLGALLHVLFWVAIIGLIIYLVRKSNNKNEDKKNPSSSVNVPLDIVKQRYAKGEITKEEFDQLKSDLE